ncbi:meiotic sister-chromatid recombination aldehyde dehydrogenase [Rhodotorula diobovata]|uniref:Meiotic sister-chromatid recombination aldehyde dehydrogenase n=1 Tax=Rhodotorula diobovata TaxID=5288 RepID=A0A5C5FRT4_9BASI|nr:meiotic sister-chromatid recombination aldehyde dehydrogenase [Rhodotorula diobovata]
MAVGSRLDALVGQLDQHTLRSLVLGAVPLVGVWLYLRLVHVPASESAVRFRWTAPAEISSSWTGRTLLAPSIHAHKADPSLLPASPDSLADPARSYITCYAPASAQHLATVPALNGDEVRERVGKAAQAQRGWRDSSWTRRRRVLRSLLEWTVNEAEALSKVASRDSGKTLVDAAFGEILTTCEKLRWLLANAESALAPEYRPTNLVLAHKVSKVVFEPLGVVAALVSWNYPLHNALGPIVAALAAGDAIVVKPSEQVAWSSLVFIEAVRDCLAACGEDPELVQVVVTLPESVEALTSDARIKHITFIGSEEVGKKVALKAAEVGTPVLLELGGKDPAVLCPSAELGYFADTWMRGVFQSGGQNCIGTERFLVHSSLYDSFVSTMRDRISLLQLGDVLSPDAAGKQIDVGAMISDRLFGELEDLIAEAVKEGARCLVGGERAQKDVLGAGHYFQPTLLVDVTPSMRIAQQEIFAPVMTVMRYETLDEAIALANGTRYGLGAAVFGRSQKECRYVMDGLECGMVCSNDFGVFYLNQSLPFGGAKASGNALRFAGPEGLRGLSNLKAVTEDRLHGWVQTGIPPLLAYPIKSGQGAWTFVQGLIRLMYGRDARQRAGGIWGLVAAR